MLGSEQKEISQRRWGNDSDGRLKQITRKHQRELECILSSQLM